MTAYAEKDGRKIERDIKNNSTNRNSSASIRSKSNKNYPEKNESISDIKIGEGRPCPPIQGDRKDFIVKFDGPDDRTNPQNLPYGLWIISICVIIYTCFTNTFGSSAFSSSQEVLSSKFNVGLEVTTLCTSFFVLGYAFGPIVWGPLSDLYGRKIILVISTFIYLSLTFGIATAENIQTILICRLFSGFAAASGMVVSAAVLAEVTNHSNRGNIITIFGMVLFVGPLLAPVINSFIVKNQSLGWRWCVYLQGILGSSALALIVFLYPETHNGIILSQKASYLRKKTGNWCIFAEFEHFSYSYKEIVTKLITLPIHMLYTEIILLLITLYNGFIFGLLYLLLTAIPFIFGAAGYGFSEGISSLPYIGIILGVQFGGIVNYIFEKRYMKIVTAKKKLVPEERLVPMMIGAVAFPVGLFWMGWTGQYPSHIHWIVPTISTAFIGFGLVCIFLPSFNYLIECYLPYTASAMAANTMVRYIFGAVFPLFARQMYDKLKVNWATSLLGFVALLLLPIPFLFYKYGMKLRNASKRCLKV